MDSGNQQYSLGINYLTVFQTALRGKGWIVPNYGAPPAESDVEMLRVVGKQQNGISKLPSTLTMVYSTRDVECGPHRATHR